MEGVFIFSRGGLMNDNIGIEFATCDRQKALEFIRRIYPSKKIEDSPTSAGILLDYVEKDIIRIQDPFMYGTQIKVVPGTKWKESKELKDEIFAACMIFHK